jgi:hypothetical protein
MSAVEKLYIIDTALNRVQFPLCNWLEINKTKYIALLVWTQYALTSLFLGYGVHTSLLTLLHKFLIPPTPLKKGGKILQSPPF